MKLKLKLTEFQIQITEFVSRYEAIEKVNFTTEEELDKRKSTYMEICEEAETLLKTKIEPIDNDYYLSFKESKPHFKNIEKEDHSFEMRCNELLSKAKEKKTDLQRFYKLISVSDVLLNKFSEEEIKARKSFSIRDKKSLILEKLFQLNDGWYYSIKTISIGNNINSARPDEFLGLSKSLEKENLIEIFRANHEDVLARLTIHGQEFVEDVISKRLKIGKAVVTIKSDLGYDSADLNLTEIKTKLKESVSKNDFKEVLEKLDLILEEDCDMRNDLLMMMGRFESIESKRRNGLFSDSEYLIQENKIRYDLISIIEGLKNGYIK
ncbi:MAG: hypothetical protein ACI8YQ_001558 [Polaribacter sp.]|jgi:hypothetical protein